MFTTKHPPAEVAQNKSRAAVGCALVPPALAAGGLCIPLAVAEQDHQLRSAKTIERKCCLIVTCRHTHQKTGRGAYYLLLNEPIFCVLAPIIAMLLWGSRYWPGTPPPPPPRAPPPPLQLRLGICEVSQCGRSSSDMAAACVFQCSCPPINDVHASAQLFGGSLYLWLARRACVCRFLLAVFISFSCVPGLSAGVVRPCVWSVRCVSSCLKPVSNPY
jgi:hypothetical protein